MSEYKGFIGTIIIVVGLLVLNHFFNIVDLKALSTYKPANKTVQKANKISPKVTNNSKPQNTKDTQSAPVKSYNGNPIPNWVYTNSSPADDYYYILNSSSNMIFFSYANCPRGQSYKLAAQRALSKTGTSGKFVLKADLKPEGTVTAPNCKKIFERISPENFNKVVVQRQGNGNRHAILNIGDGRYCIPPLVNGQLPDGACKCGMVYLMDNCMRNFCIINPRARRIVIVPFNEDALANELNKLKNNW